METPREARLAREEDIDAWYARVYEEHVAGFIARHGQREGCPQLCLYLLHEVIVRHGLDGREHPALLALWEGSRDHPLGRMPPVPAGPGVAAVPLRLVLP